MSGRKEVIVSMQSSSSPSSEFKSDKKSEKLMGSIPTSPTSDQPEEDSPFMPIKKASPTAQIAEFDLKLEALAEDATIVAAVVMPEDNSTSRDEVILTAESKKLMTQESQKSRVSTDVRVVTRESLGCSNEKDRSIGDFINESMASLDDS